MVVSFNMQKSDLADDYILRDREAYCFFARQNSAIFVQWVYLGNIRLISFMLGKL